MCLVVIGSPNFFFFFFFNDTATTEIYTLSLHDALPISGAVGGARLLRELVQEQIQQPRLVDEPQLLRSEEHTSELQSPCNLVCRLLLEKKKISGKTTMSSQHVSVYALDRRCRSYRSV